MVAQLHRGLDQRSSGRVPPSVETLRLVRKASSTELGTEVLPKQFASMLVCLRSLLFK